MFSLRQLVYTLYYISMLIELGVKSEGNKIWKEAELEFNSALTMA